MTETDAYVEVSFYISVCSANLTDCKNQVEDTTLVARNETGYAQTTEYDATKTSENPDNSFVKTEFEVSEYETYVPSPEERTGLSIFVLFATAC